MSAWANLSRSHFEKWQLSETFEFQVSELLTTFYVYHFLCYQTWTSGAKWVYHFLCYQTWTSGAKWVYHFLCYQTWTSGAKWVYHFLCCQTCTSGAKWVYHFLCYQTCTSGAKWVYHFLCYQTWTSGAKSPHKRESIGLAGYAIGPFCSLVFILQWFGLKIFLRDHKNSDVDGQEVFHDLWWKAT